MKASNAKQQSGYHHSSGS